MDSDKGTKTFLMEIYWRQRAFAIYQRRNSSGRSIPNSVTITSLDGSNEFIGQHFADVSDAIRSIERA
ncbi:hypothetical protein [Shewanella xiamenensis]|uniref:hypothetical protein n=1 Tax=Shewanella xiamenensis TaxID=332186 RepID=UPI00313ECEB7